MDLIVRISYPPQPSDYDIPRHLLQSPFYQQPHAQFWASPRVDFTKPYVVVRMLHSSSLAEHPWAARSLSRPVARAIERQTERETNMKMRLMVVCAVAALLAISVAAQAESITLYTPTAGDATYAWNSKSGPWGYGAGDTAMGVGLSMGGQYGNDYTVSIFEIPIAPLAGQNVTSAQLVVDSLGFSTGYWYGSATIGWLDPGSTIPTGDAVADGLGPASTGRPGGFGIYNSDNGDTPGPKSFDVLSCVLTDMAAGRSFSTFVLSGSRDTYGSICTAESGSGPRIIATVPEPATMAMMGVGLVGMLLRRRRKG